MNEQVSIEVEEMDGTARDGMAYLVRIYSSDVYQTIVAPICEDFWRCMMSGWCRHVVTC